MVFDSSSFRALSDVERQDQLVELLSSPEAFSEAFPNLDIFISLLEVGHLFELHLAFNRLEHMPSEWKRLVRRSDQFLNIMKVSPESCQERLLNWLLLHENECKRLIFWRKCFSDYGYFIRSE